MQGGILIEVASLEMSFENDTGFAMPERESGDDHSFLLQPVACRQGRGAGGSRAARGQDQN